MPIKRLQGDWERRNGCYYEFDTDSEPLGEGGMGVVYLGYCVSKHSEAKHYVAIKQLRDDLSQEGYQRAIREASIRIRHDNLIEMLGFITSVESDPFDGKINRHYVISEFLYGVLLSDVISGQCRDSKGVEIPFVKTLSQRLMTDRLETAVIITRNVLAGLQTLHDRGYIHRDIDPSNIMVTASGQIKLIDFGIAKEVKSLGTSDRLLTVSGEFVGKPEYAAPELVLGDIRSQNFHTDLYAVGILLFQLLSGQLPFTGSRYEVFQRQLKTNLPVKMLEVKRPVREVVRKATEKDSSKRYSSAAEFRVDLDKAVRIPNPDPSLLKILISITICCIVGGFVAWKLINVSEYSGEGETVVIDKDKENSKPVDEQFKDASELFASNTPDSIKVGFYNLQKMADDGYAPAARLIAQLYFPAIDKLCTEKKNELLLKQDAVRLNDMGNVDASSLVISYLGNSADDVLSYYMLGYCYWRLSKFNDGVQALDKAASLYDKTGSDAVTKGEIERMLELCIKK
ncbi:MAG: serine/threonine-protein kinase [Bacteroidales bacterium]|nr:serine/threonine-protein kinase [Bacteroidales bacterium]